MWQEVIHLIRIFPLAFSGKYIHSVFLKMMIRNRIRLAFMKFCIIADSPFNYFSVPSSKLRWLLATGHGKQMWSPLEPTELKQQMKRIL